MHGVDEPRLFFLILLQELLFCIITSGTKKLPEVTISSRALPSRPAWVLQELLVGSLEGGASAATACSKPLEPKPLGEPKDRDTASMGLE